MKTHRGPCGGLRNRLRQRRREHGNVRSSWPYVTSVAADHGRCLADSSLPRSGPESASDRLACAVAGGRGRTPSVLVSAARRLKPAAACCSTTEHGGLPHRDWRRGQVAWLIRPDRCCEDRLALVDAACAETTAQRRGGRAHLTSPPPFHRIHCRCAEPASTQTSHDPAPISVSRSGAYHIDHSEVPSIAITGAR
ncbi:MAG: hypothetical protein V7607_1719 [Solirubrobacteraceae bacterium]